MKEDILELIQALHISGKYVGMKYLAKTVEIIAEDGNVVFCISKNIYPRVAKEYGVTVSGVERDVRTVVNVCWRSIGHEKLNEIFGCEPTSCPTAKKFIGAMVSYIGERQMQGVK